MVTPIKGQHVNLPRDTLELFGRNWPAIEPVQQRQFLEHLSRHPDFARFGRCRDPRAQVDRIATDHLSIGQHRPVVQADTHLELVLPRTRRIDPGDAFLELNQRRRCHIRPGKRKECAITRGVDDTTACDLQAALQQIQVHLLQLAPGGVAKTFEIRCGSHDIGKRQRQRMLESACQLLLQHALQPNNVGHVQRADVNHGHDDNSAQGHVQAWANRLVRMAGSLGWRWMPAYTLPTAHCQFSSNTMA